jgi:regulator of protease activity HflC (stomatin/prohibitin superfamily)
MFWIFLAILCGLAIAGISIWRASHNSIVREKATYRFPDDDAKVEAAIAQNAFPVPSAVNTVLYVAIAAFIGLGTFNNVFFYAEPGYKYHVRTILGQEKAVDDVGYNMHLFGRVNAWKKSMSIVAKAQYDGVNEDNTEAESENDNMTSSILGPVRTIFLDQVDSQISATARFMLPADEESFLAIARQYRSPDNLIRTTLLPAFRETLQANAALMGAEDYFAGKRTEFNIDFEEQLKGGLYLVKRREVVQQSPQNSGAASANASLETEQTQFGDEDKVVFVVEKILDSSGVPVRKAQSYAALGITVVESRITDVVPNAKFNERMQLKQKASADRAIAREQRIQEEEQKLLAEAKGEREVAERKAASLVEQIEKTTDAETTKQLAITAANQQKEAAEIDKERSEILLEKARIDAQAVQVAADAEAYKKREILNADNALAQKLDAWVEINKHYADALAKRAVPTTTFSSGGGTGGEGYAQGLDVQSFMQILTMKAAKDLDVDVAVKK